MIDRLRNHPWLCLKALTSEMNLARNKGIAPPRMYVYTLPERRRACACGVRSLGDKYSDASRVCRHLSLLRLRLRPRSLAILIHDLLRRVAGTLRALHYLFVSSLLLQPYIRAWTFTSLPSGVTDISARCRSPPLIQLA